MGRSCAVVGCSSNEDFGPIEFTFHSIPRNELGVKKWLQAIGNPKFPLNCPSSKRNSFLVCSRHFHATDFISLQSDRAHCSSSDQSHHWSTQQRKRLKKGMVPAFFKLILDNCTINLLSHCF